jgi:hypothetical protein
MFTGENHRNYTNRDAGSAPPYLNRILSTATCLNRILNIPTDAGFAPPYLNRILSTATCLNRILNIPTEMLDLHRHT